MPKEFFCDRCGCHVATYESGSKLLKGATMLCPDCTIIRQGAEFLMNDKFNDSNFKLDQKFTGKIQKFLNGRKIY